MTRTIEHVLARPSLPFAVSEHDRKVTVTCSTKGSFPVRFLGKLHGSVSGFAFVREFIPNENGLGGRFETAEVRVPLKLKILRPNGLEYGGEPITVDFLNNFRTLQGVTLGEWSYTVEGETTFDLLHPSSFLREVRGDLFIMLEESIPSQSAPPLVDDALPAPLGHEYSFDLFRVGTFTATARGRRLVLTDPDGIAVATADDRLTFPIGLATIDKSRTADGKVRPWSLQVSPGPASSADTPVFATVVQQSILRTQLLQDRIDFLLGPHGSKLEIAGSMTPDELLIRLRILDRLSAETFDMHDLLDGVIKKVLQEPGANTNIKPFVNYMLFRKKRQVSGLNLTDFRLSVGSIDITLGASEHLQPPIPALKVRLGDVVAKLEVEKGITLATAKLRDDELVLEVGLRLNPDGTFVVESFLANADDLFDIDLALGAATLLAILVPLGLTIPVLVELVEETINDLVANTFVSLMAQAVGEVPQVLAALTGAEFTYRSLRLDGDNFVFEYVAPVELEAAPAQRFEYEGVIGRRVDMFSPFGPIITDPPLGDTFQAPNLMAKIDHIVVIMMENRSYDHVLGYLAQAAGGESLDGLSSALVQALQEQGFTVAPLKHSKLPANGSCRKTRMTESVGHTLADVAEQLQTRSMALGRLINSPRGFVDNFARKNKLTAASEIKPDDVLGFYDGEDLPFFDFLVKNYAYCEQYFSSHPGPTFPNRFFLLTGNVQFDRNGEAILDNPHINFQLLRTPTIFDLLTRKGVEWRVYESFPSVTGLRLFARYTMDNTNIVDVRRLPADVANGDLPSVVFIDPAMHHEPENDDHAPRADMYRGQQFLQSVYSALRSNDDVWRRTLLVITYDEHGGFYDHVIPPVADMLRLPLVANPHLPGGGGGDGNGFVIPSPQLISYGLRVPTFVVSPWAPAGRGPDLVLDHCSILKTILVRFCGESRPFLSSRVSASHSLDAYLSAPEPRMDVALLPALPPLPEDAGLLPPEISTEPISDERLASNDVDFEEYTGAIARMLGR